MAPWANDNLPMFPVHPGASPQYSKGTYIPVFPTQERQSSWAGRITNNTENTVTMGITPTPDCIVGKYHMYVAVVTPFGIRRTRKDDSRNLYILFNPWASGRFRLLDKKQLLWKMSSHFHLHELHMSCCRSSADAVFLDDETERQECVMNEMGIIYHGAYDDIAERDWNYGQVVEWPTVDFKTEFQRFLFFLLEFFPA